MWSCARNEESPVYNVHVRKTRSRTKYAPSDWEIPCLGAGKFAPTWASKYFALDIGRTSQSPFAIFSGQPEHDDKEILSIQEFIEINYKLRLTIGWKDAGGNYKCRIAFNVVDLGSIEQSIAIPGKERRLVEL